MCLCVTPELFKGGSLTTKLATISWQLSTDVLSLKWCYFWFQTYSSNSSEKSNNKWWHPSFTLLMISMNGRYRLQIKLAYDSNVQVEFDIFLQCELIRKLCQHWKRELLRLIRIWKLFSIPIPTLVLNQSQTDSSDKSRKQLDHFYSDATQRRQGKQY